MVPENDYTIYLKIVECAGRYVIIACPMAHPQHQQAQLKVGSHCIDGFSVET